MGPELLHRLRWLLPALAGIAIAVLVSVLGQTSGRAADVPLSIAVQGNHFVNGAGQTVRLLGVNHPSFEYACEEGYAYNDGNMDAADAAAIASWHATAVRVPLNEDCWLGINGQPNSSQGADPPLTMAGYRQAVQNYVSQLNAAGLYVILDLHWTAPGNVVADGQRPMPDTHSVDFWTSVASTFKTNPAVVFDAFNEPFSPDKVNDPAHSVSWSCWKNGGCSLSVVNDSDAPTGATYQAVGMQTLVNTIRATGAGQPILLGGLSYANDLTGWLANEPNDPDGQLAASFHNYQGEACDSQACWDSQIAPVAAHVPVVTGEFDQDVCQPTTFDTDYMKWADDHGIGYLAWGWWVLSAQEKSDAGCSAFYLISDPSGTPAAPNGTALHDHLAALAAGGGSPTTTTTGGGSTTTTGGGSTTTTGGAPPPGKGNPAPGLRSFSSQVNPGGTAVRFLLRSSQDSAGTLTGRTVNSFAIATAKQHRRRVSLGTVRFKLAAGKSKPVVLKLSKASRRLLSRQHQLKVQITITLINSANHRGVTHRTLTLQHA
jgi:endoglucanase